MKHGHVLNREFHRALGLEKPGIIKKVRKAVTRFCDWAHTPVGDFVGCAVCYAAMLVGMFLLMLWGM
jgi:hypothetical protein